MAFSSTMSSIRRVSCTLSTSLWNLRLRKREYSLLQPMHRPYSSPSVSMGCPQERHISVAMKRNIGPALDKVKYTHYIDTIHILELVFVVVLTPPCFTLNPLVGGEGWRDSLGRSERASPERSDGPRSERAKGGREGAEALAAYAARSCSVEEKSK